MNDEGSDEFDEESGLTPFVASAIRACDAAHCDAVLFALWSRLHKGAPVRASTLFPRGTKHRVVVFGDADTTGREWDERILVWRRGERRPAVTGQRFGSVKDPIGKKRAFIDGLGERSFGSTLLMLCGEANIIRTKRGSSKIVDDFGFLKSEAYSRSRIVLNPGHTYITRPELRRKRSVYSKGGRYCVAVWNRGDSNRNEAKAPWAVYHDGDDITSNVEELNAEVRGVGGVRVGVIRLR